MSKTNSNSITSILVAALNTRKSEFRRKMIELFTQRGIKNISDDIDFFDCTHSPLLYEEMKRTEIDIIARNPGVHKPVMMIEVKAGVGEPLQESQKEGKFYDVTSRNHKIPLIYIIPNNYVHRKDLPKKAFIISWEEIIKQAGSMKVSFNTQIDNFVEIDYEEESLSKKENQLFKDVSLLDKIYNFKNNILDIIEKVLKKNRRTNVKKEENQWGVGFFYTYRKNFYFIGFNPYYNENNYKDENKKAYIQYFFALDIAETTKNSELGDKKHLFFADGYYFIPILGSNIQIEEKNIIREIRTKLKEKGIDSIDKTIRENFETFFALQTKIGEEEIKNQILKVKNNEQ